jgi:hypothetical protein
MHFLRSGDRQALRRFLHYWYTYESQTLNWLVSTRLKRPCLLITLNLLEVSVFLVEPMKQPNPNTTCIRDNVNELAHQLGTCIGDLPDSYRNRISPPCAALIELILNR